MSEYKVRSTSRNSAVTEDIVLRESTTTKTIFRPVVVNNPHDKNSAVRGQLVFLKSSKGGEWVESKPVFNLTTLKQGECAKFDLHTDSISRLLEEALNLRELYQKYGIRFGTHRYVVTEANIASIIEQVSKFENKDAILDALRKLEEKDLQNLSSILGVSKIKRLIAIWHENETNDEEDFWQTTFEDHPWVLSQIFASPYIFIQGKPYFGGKSDKDAGGVKGDLIYKNIQTNNAAFIEIKTPVKPLLNIGLYRGKGQDDENSVRSASSELSGGVVQVLNQRNVLLRKKDSISATRYDSHLSKCILIVGDSRKLGKIGKKSFDLFRNSNKEVEIITFDELFMRLEKLSEVLNA